MSNPATPGWPEAGAFPFMPFPLPGATASPASLQGLSGGIDMLRDFWSRMPGSAAVPGFMLPTVDVEELDKRIGDLKAAERWVEVNLNMLRATIQGLEVQRHTIAAIQALTTPPDPTKAAGSPPSSSLPPGWPSAPPKVGGDAAAPAERPAPDPEASSLPPPANDWLAYLQAQFTKVAQSAMTPTMTATATPTPTKDVASRGKAAKKVATRTRKPTATR